MSEAVTVAIGLFVAAVGVLLVLVPGAMARVEEVMNAPLGRTYVFALRLGSRCEEVLEEPLNRPILQRGVYWDGFVRRRPRLAGALFLLAGVAVTLLGV